MLLGRPRAFVMDHAYWGDGPRPGEVEEVLEERGARYERIDEEATLIGRVVERLQEGKVVGWFQGRSEWGPRALGNRSILADPRRPEMRDLINARIKFREPFRPFAPSITAEQAERYVVLPGAARHYPARFMLYVVEVREDRRDRIPAVTHVDGTGRLQAVHRAVNPRYHRLIEAFGQATGVPVLLNTSFNLKGTPMVNTPREAYDVFVASDLDVLVLGDCVVEKRGAGPRG
jgi:carbamoyltransferase